MSAYGALVVSVLDLHSFIILPDYTKMCMCWRGSENFEASNVSISSVR